MKQAINQQQDNQSNEVISFDEFFQKKTKKKSNREFQIVEMTTIATKAALKGLSNIIIVDSLPIDEAHKESTAKLMQTARGYVQNTLKKIGYADMIYVVLNLQDLPQGLSEAQVNFLKALYALRHRADDYVNYYQSHLAEVKNKVK